MSFEPRNPHELAIDPSPLQEKILALLEDAGIDTETSDKILDMVEEAELCRAERDYDRHQESLMENGPGPTLLEQQAAAQKLK